MKIKDGYILRNVAGSNVVVAVGEESRRFNKIIKLNDTAAFIFGCLSEDTTEDGIVKKLLDKYEVSPDVAKADVSAILSSLGEAGLLV